MSALPYHDATTAAASSEAFPSFAAPPSSSLLSDLPMTDLNAPESVDEATNRHNFAYTTPKYSASTEELLKRINTNAAIAAKAGTPGWEAAREEVMKHMATSDKMPTPPLREASAAKRGGRGGKRASFVANGSGEGGEGVFKLETEAREPARGSGRARGRGRGRGGGRGGKRKRADSDDDSDISESYTPIATKTKSGRAVQKPTTFTPPSTVPSTNKKRRTYTRRDPEKAVCKVCLRGTSPASNMIVFCDGCNTPYHMYCHHPPIDQGVVDEVEKEWFCKDCAAERAPAISEEDVERFVSAESASMEQRRKYFTSLPSTVLAALLTKATSLHSDLPVFSSDFQSSNAPTTDTEPATTQPSANGHQPQPQSSSGAQVTSETSAPAQQPALLPDQEAEDAEGDGYGSDEHPSHYPRPGHALSKTLGPEQEDLQWLVDDNYSEVFSHIYQVDSLSANATLGAADQASGSGGV